MLTRKTLHHFLNHKPVDLPMPFKTMFYELYGDFKVNPRCLPFVFLHFLIENDNLYDIINGLDMRLVRFKAEN